jgi:hypothetical protein
VSSLEGSSSVHPFIASLWLAYVDPSTGGLFFQLLSVIFAAISGGLFFFSRQMKSAFARLRRLLNERLSRS